MNFLKRELRRAEFRRACRRPWITPEQVLASRWYRIGRWVLIPLAVLFRPDIAFRYLRASFANARNSAQP
jgi:hypothetical protein